ncbi:MAG TPA: aminotransferase class V-fold PLP-dependent enzyme [Ignavibacteriaceae bacterium]|nr:aminotransferase class V-fold PLP-dependent enzyme [Ignavibacteriaceae bacterium]
MPTRRQFINQFAIAGTGALMLLKFDALARANDAVQNTPPQLSPSLTASDEDFWGRIQSAFEVDRSIINLNNGGVSPSPASVSNALKQYIDYSNKGPSYFMWRHLEPNIELVREKLAKSFGVDKEEVAITRNASESLENVQLGIPMNAGDEVITTTQDYPRMLTTWQQRARRENIVIKKVSYKIPTNNFDELLTKIEKEITPRTKVIHVSHTIFLTGQIIPVKEISKIAHQHGVLLICDGAHSFNHFPYKQSDLDCDFFGTSLHKWTYAPIGTGFLYVRKELIKNIWSLFASDEKQENDIRKFEEIGTHPAANHNAIAEALAFNETIGIERKAERFRYLHGIWINRLRKYENVKFLVNIDDPNQYCGIVNVHFEGTDPVKVVNHLLDKHKIFTVAIVHDEFKGIRVTPNVYTLVSEMEIFADAMEKIAKGEVKDLGE